MLIGEYQHTLDSKKRLSLPAKFRKEMGKGLVVTRGLDTCLFLFPAVSWRAIAKKLKDLPFGEQNARGISRFLLAGATEVEIDAAGRILIPDFLRTFARLNGKIICAGLSDRVELWDEKLWVSYKHKIERQAPEMAQTLGNLGIL
jgi:MraZ protein